MTSFAGGPGSSQPAEREGVLAAASAEERLREAAFADLSEAELAAMRRMMERLRFSPPLRLARRRRRGHHGDRIDLRATMRRSLRSGGETLEHVHRRRRLRPRRLVLLLDVSGSMEPYARALLQFLDSAVEGVAAEAFVFATRLTRLTHSLGRRETRRALARAVASAPDWSGGTRIGEALAEFNNRHGRRGLARGAVVVILSDGWESGDPALVGREMERLARLAHRVLWINPRAASPAFAPLTGGMSAALPHCDTLLSGHSFAALEAVADEIARNV